MFTENELVNFTTITSHFEDECKRVVLVLKDTTNGFYHYLAGGGDEEFIYNSRYRRVDCYTDCHRTYLGSFPISFLLKSGDEIRKIVDKEPLTADELQVALDELLDELVGEQRRKIDDLDEI